MSKHTPGPWLHGKYADRVTTQEGDGTDSICHVYNNGGNQEANAKLIAAAPDLLAACKAALYLLGNDEDRKAIGDKPWEPQLANAVPGIIREALRKAGQ